jgi:hypothetical protein
MDSRRPANGTTVQSGSERPSSSVIMNDVL